MDVNGTKFHLIHLKEDWQQWCSVKHKVRLKEVFKDDFEDAEVEWNPAEGNLRLARQVILFPGANTQPKTSLENRRGAGRDRYGHWYWIDGARTGIRFLAREEMESVEFWSSLSADSCDPLQTLETGQFHTRAPEQAQPMTLCGLAVTAGHYLVVGVVGQGVLLFDLHRGGPPQLLLWSLPEGQTFVPLDIAPTPDGGILILDKENRRYWRLNRYFQLKTTLIGSEETPPETTFQPKNGGEEPRRVKQSVPHVGYLLAGNADFDEPLHPISIESGPAGRVLILNASDEELPDGDEQPSTVYEYERGVLNHVYTLTFSVSDEDEGTETRSLEAHDFTYLHHTGESSIAMPLQCVEQAGEEEELHMLFVARRNGNQVIAFKIDFEDQDIADQPDYLPLRRWQEKGLVAAGQQVHYDFEDRWIPLGVFIDCAYATSAVIESPVDFDRAYRKDEPVNRLSLTKGIPGQPFDSNIIGCVWHRLLMDAEIPPGTQVLVEARASDEAETLSAMPWISQPRPYQRSGGAELPYFDPYHARCDDPALSEWAGTWETLLQNVNGRFLQVRLTILGTGRATPEILSVRLWYPRFSYRDHYLPAIFSEEPVSAGFTERFLANYEGYYTNLEDKMVQLSSLLDPRIAPPETLDWLADWLGVVLHPLWEEERRRFFIRFAHRLYQIRGTIPGVIAALRIFLDDELDDSLFDPECLQQSNIRIVEHFLTRDFAGTIYGDPQSGTATGLTVAEAAHRFSVLIPFQFEAETAVTEDAMKMVERIVELEKPAHTWFDIREYWNMFRVGEARLGLDTQIGYSTYFIPLVLGDAILPHATLGCPYPFDVADRFVMGRNKVISN